MLTIVKFHSSIFIVCFVLRSLARSTLGRHLQDVKIDKRVKSRGLLQESSNRQPSHFIPTANICLILPSPPTPMPSDDKGDIIKGIMLLTIHCNHAMA